ncbi:MAG: hypothetical protein FWC42_09080 [Proteobacteria bacterium]|nr:hypothetical protein [Pseudomonadota bacterium]MCL2310404.1 hypothetical protein [Pseudomonadota bacterium]
MKFITDPPTLENLKSLYQSEMYQNLLKVFSKRSKLKLDNRDYDDATIQILLNYAQRRYMVLNIPFAEVFSEFEKNKSALLAYFIATTEFFNEEDENPDGEFPEGEEPGEENKSKVKETFGIARTFFIDKFCEFYLLKTGDKERLLSFLKATRMPFAKKYASQIEKLYQQALSCQEPFE